MMEEKVISDHEVFRDSVLGLFLSPSDSNLNIGFGEAFTALKYEVA